MVVYVCVFQRGVTVLEETIEEENETEEEGECEDAGCGPEGGHYGNERIIGSSSELLRLKKLHLEVRG